VKTGLIGELDHFLGDAEGKEKKGKGETGTIEVL